MRGKPTLLSLVALFTGLATSIAVTRALEEPSVEVSVEAASIVQESILVAAANIDVGEPFGSQNVKLIECPANRIPGNCVREFSHLKSSFASCRLEVDEPIVHSHLQERLAATRPATRPGIRPVGRSLRLQVAMDAPVSDAIQAGDCVQVVVVQEGDNGQQSDSRIVLRSAVVEAMGPGMERQAEKHGSALLMKQVSLLVQETEVPLILLAQELGRLHIATSNLDVPTYRSGKAACTIADLLTFAVDRKKVSSEPSQATPTEAGPGFRPATNPPVVTPPVVKDLNTLGDVKQNDQRRKTGLAKVITPGTAEAGPLPTRAGRGTQLTVSDDRSPSETATKPVVPDSLRE